MADVLDGYAHLEAADAWRFGPEAVADGRCGRDPPS